MTDWADYQEETANFFRSMGLEAKTNAPIKGVRTSHNIDVAVRSKHVGFDLIWLVECKLWKTAVSKLHVLALREIVSDIGADRGIIMAEKGFQSGALEAAQLTNVQLTSLAELKVSASHALGMARLRQIQERLDKCWARYFGLSKEVRIKHSLRQPWWDASHEYESYTVFQVAIFVLNHAFARGFPIMRDRRNPFLQEIVTDDGSNCLAKTPAELIESLEPMIAELEDRLDVVYSAMSSAETIPTVPDETALAVNQPLTVFLFPGPKPDEYS
jgi:restriction system protein